MWKTEGGHGGGLGCKLVWLMSRGERGGCGAFGGASWVGEGGRVADDEQRGRKVRHLMHHEWATMSSRMANVG